MQRTYRGDELTIEFIFEKPFQPFGHTWHECDYPDCGAFTDETCRKVVMEQHALARTRPNEYEASLYSFARRWANEYRAREFRAQTEGAAYCEHFDGTCWGHSYFGRTSITFQDIYAFVPGFAGHAERALA